MSKLPISSVAAIAGRGLRFGVARALRRAGFRSAGGRAVPCAPSFNLFRVGGALCAANLLLTASSARAALPPLYGDLVVTNVIEITAGQSYTLQGTYTDRTIRGYTVADIAVGDMIVTEDVQGYVDPWLITNILAASGQALSAQVQHAGDGATNAPMSGVMAIVCAVSSNVPLPPDAANAAISEYLALGARNYALQLLALRESGSGTGGTTNLFSGPGSTGLVTSAAADTNKYLRGDGTWAEIPTNPASADASTWPAYPQTGYVYRVIYSLTNSIWVSGESSTNESWFDVRGLYTAQTNLYDGKTSWTSTNSCTIRWYNNIGIPFDGYAGWGISNGPSIYFVLTNNADYPIGEWLEHGSVPPEPTSVWTNAGSATYEYGFDSLGVFRIRHAGSNTVSATGTNVFLTVPITAPNLGTAAGQDTDDFAAAAHQHDYTAITNPPWLTSMTLGTGPTDAYPGDAGHSVSGRADQAYTAGTSAQATASAALPKSGGTMTGNLDMGGKAITNADYIVLTNTATYSTEGARPFWVTDTSGRLYPTGHKMEIATRTISFTTNMTAGEIQALIDGAGKYIPYGVTLTFQFGDGTYTMTNGLTFAGFCGGGTLNIKSTGTTTSAHRNQPATLDFSSLGSTYSFYVSKNSCRVYINNIRFVLDGSVAYGAVRFSQSQHVEFSYNSVTSAGGTSSWGVFSDYGSTVYVYRNIVDNQSRALQAQFAGLMTVRETSGTNNATAYYGIGGILFIFSGTLLGNTNVSGGIVVAPDGAVLP